jgi:hypothetical protein
MNETVMHRRYCHPGQTTMGLIMKNENIKKEKTSPGCEACMRSKGKRKPFKAYNTGLKELDCLVADICGPLRHKTIAGAMYFLTVIDKHSRYSTVHTLQGKKN